ncbi:MAG: PAC2 family protein [Chloroflexi bacterium]|nr:PAC2 family protein [Chloroflexota bacterium]
MSPARYKTPKRYKTLKLRNPAMIAAWPGMGHVGIGAVNYLKEMLGVQEIGELDLPELFDLPGVYIENGIAQLPRFPESKFYYCKIDKSESDLVIFIGESQPASIVMDVAEELQVRMIYTCAAAPANISHKQKPLVLAVSNKQELINYLRDFDVSIMVDGSISGMNGILLGVAAERNIGGMCLLGQLPYYTVAIPNPRSSRAVLEILCKMLNIEVNMRDMELLIKESDEEIDQLIKSSEQVEDIIGHVPQENQQQQLTESTEKMKSLEDEIKIRSHIEKLFEITEKDRAKAHELKAELDKWDLFKEYEDRFLGLFRKENQ